MEHHYCSDSEAIMLSTKATALLLFAIIGVSCADPSQDRSNNNPNSESWYHNNPDYQHSVDTASQHRQNPGHQNAAPATGRDDRIQRYPTRRDDRQSYLQKPTPDGSLKNPSPVTQRPFLKPFPEIKPFQPTQDLVSAIHSMDSQHPAGSGSKTYLGSVTVQKGNTYNTDPNSTNIYGSVTHISGLYLSPADQEQLERMNRESLSLDDSNSRSYQTIDGRTVNMHGAVTYQANTDYPSQSQHSTQQSIRSHQTDGTQSVPQESPEVQQLRYLQMKIGDLTIEIGAQNEKLKRIQSSIDMINQFVKRIDSTVYALWNAARPHQ